LKIKSIKVWSLELGNTSDGRWSSPADSHFQDIIEKSIAQFKKSANFQFMIDLKEIRQLSVEERILMVEAIGQYCGRYDF